MFEVTINDVSFYCNTEDEAHSLITKFHNETIAMVMNAGWDARQNILTRNIRGQVNLDNYNYAVAVFVDDPIGSYIDVAYIKYIDASYHGSCPKQIIANHDDLPFEKIGSYIYRIY